MAYMERLQIQEFITQKEARKDTRPTKKLYLIMQDYLFHIFQECAVWPMSFSPKSN